MMGMGGVGRNIDGWVIDLRFNVVAYLCIYISRTLAFGNVG